MFKRPHRLVSIGGFFMQSLRIDNIKWLGFILILSNKRSDINGVAPYPSVLSVRVVFSRSLCGFFSFLWREKNSRQRSTSSPIVLLSPTASSRIR
jgi:hypothetical protein